MHAATSEEAVFAGRLSTRQGSFEQETAAICLPALYFERWPRLQLHTYIKRVLKTQAIQMNQWCISFAGAAFL